MASRPCSARKHEELRDRTSQHPKPRLRCPDPRRPVSRTPVLTQRPRNVKPKPPKSGRRTVARPVPQQARMLPTPVPPADAEHKPDLVESLQQSDLKRWSPRRAGLPPLFDWWPSYVALAALAVLAVVAASRLVVETLVPFAHVVLVFSLAAALTFAIAPLVGRLEDRMPRALAVALVFVALIV